MLANVRKDHSSPFKVFQYMENHADIFLIALQKAFPLVRSRIDTNFILSGFGSNHNDNTACWARTHAKSCKLATTFAFFYSFELKLCRMVKLCIPRNPMLTVSVGK